MTHKSPVALLRLNNSRRLKVIFIKPKCDLFHIREVLVKLAEVNISTLDFIAVRVESVRLSGLVVGEGAEVLRPVTEGGDGVLEFVGAGDVVGCCEALEQKAVVAVVGVPPHLRTQSQLGGWMTRGGHTWYFPVSSL